MRVSLFNCIIVFLVFLSGNINAQSFKKEKDFSEYLDKNKRTIPSIFGAYQHPRLVSLQGIGHAYKSKNISRIVVGSGWGYRMVLIIVLDEKVIVQHSKFGKMPEARELKGQNIFNEFDNVTVTFSEGEDYEFYRNNIYEEKKWIALTNSPTKKFVSFDGPSVVFESLIGHKYNSIILDDAVLLDEKKKPISLLGNDSLARVLGLVGQIVGGEEKE